MADESEKIPPEQEKTKEQIEKKYNLESCLKCNSDFKDKIPKLLPCLHTFCDICIRTGSSKSDVEEIGQGDAANKNETTKDTLTCPECKAEWADSDIIKNLFIPTQASDEKKDSDPDSSTHVCTACDEDQQASNFCVDCKEWLCDQCVQAHKRVRITKDHAISGKEQAVDTDSNKVMYCHNHKQESLKLFCERCDKLTCRDCQLEEHKDHKYQFVKDAITNQKLELGNFMDLIKKTKLSEWYRDLGIVDCKEINLDHKHKKVGEEIKSVAETVIKATKQWSTQLFTYLNTVTEIKTKELTEKKEELMDAISSTEYCLAFIQNALEKGEDLSLLYTKGVMKKRLEKCMNTQCHISAVNLDLALSYKHDVNTLLQNMSKLGYLQVNGVDFPGGPTPQPPPQLPPQKSNLHSSGAVHSTSAVSNLPQNVQQFFNSLPGPMREQLKTMKPEERNQYMKQIIAQRKEKMQTLLQHQHQQQQQQQHHHQQQVQHSNLQRQLRMPNMQQNFPLSRNIQHPQTQIDQNGRQVRVAGTVSVSSTFYPEPGGPVRTAMPFSSQRPQNPNYQQHVQQRMPVQYVGRGSNHPNYQPGYWPGPHTTAQARIPSPTVMPGMENMTRASPGGVSPHVSPGASNSHMSMKVKEEPSDKKHLPACAFSNRSKVDKAPDGVSSFIDLWNQTRNTDKTSAESSELSDILEANMSPQMQDVEQSAMSALKELEAFESGFVEPTLTSNSKGDTMTGKLNRGPKEYDPNEDWCACCHNGGDLLCCDKCPKVYHFKCHIPELMTAPGGDWICTLCRPDEEVKVDVPEFLTAGFGSKRKAPTGLTDKETKACERILLEIFCLEASVPFHEPVSKLVPNYYRIITNPMDLSTVKLKLTRQHFDHYNSVEQFISDMKLMFKNCTTYNDETTEVAKAGKEVEAVFDGLVHKYLPCYTEFLVPRDSVTPSSEVSDKSSDSSKPPRKKRKSVEEDMPIIHIS